MPERGDPARRRIAMGVRSGKGSSPEPGSFWLGPGIGLLDALGDVLHEVMRDVSDD
jgi:hypothetical protein